MITQVEVNELQKLLERITPEKADGNAKALKEMELEDCSRKDKVIMLLGSALDWLVYGN